jgi:hypothetical protein
MGMRHAIRMGGNLPMLERMRGVGHGQKRQAGQPKNAESASRGHLASKLGSGVAWSNPFNPNQRPKPPNVWQTLPPTVGGRFAPEAVFSQRRTSFKPKAKWPPSTSSERMSPQSWQVRGDKLELWKKQATDAQRAGGKK